MRLFLYSSQERRLHEIYSNLVPGGGRFSRTFPSGRLTISSGGHENTLWLRIKIGDNEHSKDTVRYTFDHTAPKIERFAKKRDEKSEEPRRQRSNRREERDGEKRELADRGRKRAARSKNPSSVDRRADRFLSSRETNRLQEGTRSIETPSRYRETRAREEKATERHTWATTR